MMIGVDPAVDDNILTTRQNLPASIFFTLCFYTYYFFASDFCAHKLLTCPNWIDGEARGDEAY
jgi:hypothetical protein